MYEIHYRLTEQDVIAGAMAFLRSPELRRQGLPWIVGAAALGAAMSGWDRWQHCGDWIDAAVGVVGGAVLMVVLFVSILVISQRRVAVKKFRNGESPRSRTGRLWLDEDGIVDEADGVGRTEHPFAEMVRITETRTHAFIWISPRRHLILPRRLGEAEVAAIVATVRDRIARMPASTPPVG